MLLSARVHKSTLLRLCGMFIKLIKSCSRRAVLRNAQGSAVIGTLRCPAFSPGSASAFALTNWPRLWRAGWHEAHLLSPSVLPPPSSHSSHPSSVWLGLFALQRSESSSHFLFWLTAELIINNRVSISQHSNLAWWALCSHHIKQELEHSKI